MIMNICVEKLNGHDTSGKLGKLSLKKGDRVATGDVLYSVESAKGSLEVISVYEGMVVEVVAQMGDTVKKGDVILVIEGSKYETNNPSSVTEKKEKTYNFGISKPQKETIETEVVIIGGGPGGYVAAIRCAQLGKKVVLIEEDRLGGTCLNYGCIPTKALAHSTKVLKHIKEAAHYGFDLPSYGINMARVTERKTEVVDSLVGGIAHLMAANGIRVIEGTAVVVSNSEIHVDTKKISMVIHFENLILATGSESSTINIPGNDLPFVMTNKEALALKEVPESIAIIGGGVIGMEFAFIFNALGTKVFVIEYLPEILCMLDQDVVDALKEAATQKGIQIYTGACAKEISKTENGVVMTAYQIGDTTYYLATEKVMMAVGRKARLENLNLELLGVSLNDRKNGIWVNEHMQTSVENIYAIGDVTNIIQLAHVASHQGMVAAEHLCGMDSKMHYDLVPSAIFTSPEIGQVGLSEKEAALKDCSVTVSRFPFMANGKSIAMNETERFVKIISCSETKIVLGASIIGTNGTDMIATLSNLIHAQTTLEKAAEVIYAHPTAAEAIHEAILSSLGRGLHYA